MCQDDGYIPAIDAELNSDFPKSQLPLPDVLVQCWPSLHVWAEGCSAHIKTEIDTDFGSDGTIQDQISGRQRKIWAVIGQIHHPTATQYPRLIAILGVKYKNTIDSDGYGPPQRHIHPFRME